MDEAAGMRLIDTCVNLHDEMFQGVYNEKQRHEPDWDLIVERAVAAGVERMIGVSGSLQDSEKSAL
jgi:TatD DNase family protein